MFQLTKDEFTKISMCQNATSRLCEDENISSSLVSTRKLPYAFAEQGIYMPMTALRGEFAIKQSRTLVMLFEQMEDYIGIKSLKHLQNAKEKIRIMIFGDNIGRRLHKNDRVDSCRERNALTIEFLREGGAMSKMAVIRIYV